MNAKLPWRLTLALLAQGASSAAEADKSAYHFFHPTPPELLRPMVTDSPGTTESASTVDAGHYQVEITLASYFTGKDTSSGVAERIETWSFAPVLVKAGLLNQLDAQLVLEPYHFVRVSHPAGRTTLRGFGDTTVRLKYNVWGNDSGRTALAVMPRVKIPTGDDDVGNGHVEGGLILPFEAALPADVYLGLSTRFDAVRDDDGSGYHPEFGNSIAVGRDLFEDVFGYVEFFSFVSTERNAPWIGGLGTGLTWSLTDNVQLNAGGDIGVTRSADDWGVFAGVAWRF